MSVEAFLHIGSLWPDWAPTEAERDLWLEKLSPFSDQVIKQAAGEHYADQSGMYKKPKLGKILQYCRLTQGETEQKREEGTHVLAYTMQKVDLTDNVVQSRPHYTTTDKLRQNHVGILKRAQSRVEEYERTYGGNWRLQLGAELMKLRGPGENTCVEPEQQPAGLN